MDRAARRLHEGGAGAGPRPGHRRLLRAPDRGPGAGRQGGAERERGVGGERVFGFADAAGEGAVRRERRIGELGGTHTHSSRPLIPQTSL